METQTRERILSPYRDDPASIIQALQDIQNNCGFISKEDLRAAASTCQVPYSYAYSIATFYRAFSLNERGRYIIKLCDGTACHLKMASELLAELKSELGIEPGETTADRLFSIEIVNCLGACAMAPAVSINEELHGYLTRTKLRSIVRGLRAEATGGRS